MIRNLLGLREWYPVCAEGDLAPGSGGVYPIAGREVLLLCGEDGFHALDNTCPHASAPIGADSFDGETVTCRRHFMRFDVRTGVCPDAPSWSTQRYPVRVREGVVEVGI